MVFDTDTVIELRRRIKELRRRIKELESGSCRFNCRSMKEAWMAGANWATYDWEKMAAPGKEHMKDAYIQWLKEQRDAGSSEGKST